MGSERHDAVVVGGGLGGLAAAACLARAGLRVRLLERQRNAGGYATTFQRGRFELEVSLHALSGIGAPGRRGPLWRHLEQLGIADRLEVVPIAQLYRTVAPGLDLRIPASRDGARAVLQEAFPRERAGITRIFDRVFAIEREILEAEKRAQRGVAWNPLIELPALVHATTSPLAALLYRELASPLARLALGQLWIYFGLPPSRLSLLLFAAGLARYLRFGACTLRGKSRALTRALVAAIDEAGGKVTLGDGAARILVGDGRVAGVVTDSGEVLRTGTVIANANPLSVAHELIGDEHLPSRFLARLAVAEPSTSSVCLHLGLSCQPAALGIEDHQLFLNHTTDLEAQFACTRSLDPPRSLLVTAYSVADPTFSPAGTSVLTLEALCDGRAWCALEPGAYRALKQRWADALLARAAERYPDLPGCVEVRELTTPRTNLRYTGNPQGAIYGFANTPAEGPTLRLPQQGPLAGLWFAGAWTRPGGSFELAIASGMNAARRILAARAC